MSDPNIPMWVLKVKGQSYYCETVHSAVGFSTKETPDNSHTKGSLKFKNVSVKIDNGIGYIDAICKT